MRWGILGAAWIAGRGMVPAISASRNGRLVAISSRDWRRAADMAARHAVPRVYSGYEALLDDPEIDAVYIPLPNSLHREWTVRAVEAGKHVLCEKPLALDAAEAVEMDAAARRHGRLLMEAVMYRFHPRMRELAATLSDVRYLHASFGFPLTEPDNYRMRPELGGGALLDVGCYGVDVVRWLLGEPDRVEAMAHGDPLDMTVTALLGFPSGARATVYASFESPDYQALTVVTGEESFQVDEPFTAWLDPHDPYQYMVEAFGDAVLDGEPAPLPPESSIANMKVLDRIRAAARESSSPRLGGGRWGA